MAEDALGLRNPSKSIPSPIHKEKHMNPWETPKLQVPGLFKVWFAICAILGIGTTGLLIWAIVRLVNHFAK